MKIQRFFRYIVLFGFRRALIKAAYHLNNSIGNTILKFIFFQLITLKNERIILAGLGNHGFTLIAYSIMLIAKGKISAVIDPSERAFYIANKILRCPCFKTLDCIINSGEFYGDILYVCSDHRSHLTYAKAAVDTFSSVYIEKPIIVSDHQLADLVSVNNSKLKIFTGYNRPNAPFFKKLLIDLGDKYNLTFVINGHFLPSDHWYRDSNQGSRILGNLSHWLDLSYKIFSLNEKITKLEIFLVKGYLDDITIILKQKDRNISINFSANSEPLNGVEEFLYWNSNTSLGVIENFKHFNLVFKERKISRKNLSKNVGHISTILSPFNYDNIGDLHLINSARFCLHVEEMAKKNITHSFFYSK